MRRQREIPGLTEIEALAGSAETEKPAAVILRRPGIAERDAVGGIESGGEGVAGSPREAVEVAAPHVVGGEGKLDERHLRLGSDDHLVLQRAAAGGGEREAGESHEMERKQGEEWTTVHVC